MKKFLEYFALTILCLIVFDVAVWIGVFLFTKASGNYEPVQTIRTGSSTTVVVDNQTPWYYPMFWPIYYPFYGGGVWGGYGAGTTINNNVVGASAVSQSDDSEVDDGIGEPAHTEYDSEVDDGIHEGAAPSESFDSEGGGFHGGFTGGDE